MVCTFPDSSIARSAGSQFSKSSQFARNAFRLMDTRTNCNSMCMVICQQDFLHSTKENQNCWSQSALWRIAVTSLKPNTRTKLLMKCFHTGCKGIDEGAVILHVDAHLILFKFQALELCLLIWHLGEYAAVGIQEAC